MKFQRKQSSYSESEEGERWVNEWVFLFSSGVLDGAISLFLAARVFENSTFSKAGKINDKVVKMVITSFINYNTISIVKGNYGGLVNTASNF